jgi:hypothetical protein
LDTPYGVGNDRWTTRPPLFAGPGFGMLGIAALGIAGLGARWGRTVRPLDGTLPLSNIDVT